MSGYRDIYSGILHKCGGRIKSWTKRWMVLRSDYCLYYYKDATKSHLGVISLRDTQFKIRVGQKSDVSWPKTLAMENTFALVTTPRVYFMYAETIAEAEEWRKVLEDAHKDLVEVTRTKSFSGFRQHTASTIDREASFASRSVNAVQDASFVGGARPKAHTSVTDSLASDASSVFGRQFTLSSSSETGSPLPTVEEVESMYNVLQHPVTQDNEGAGPAEEGENGVNLNEALYSKPPARTRTSSDIEREYDYVLPPDADTPQNFSVTVTDSDQHTTSSKLAELDPKWAELSGKGLSTSSQTEFEGFYDLAGGVSDKQQQQQQQQQEELAVYDVVRPENTSQTPPRTLPTSSSATPPRMTSSALNQPLPAIPPSGLVREEHTMIYEDVPDIPRGKRETTTGAPVYDVLENPSEGVVYELVGVVESEGAGHLLKGVGQQEEEDVYSEVGSSEERTPPPVSRGGRYVNVAHGNEGGEKVVTSEVGNYVNVSSGGETPPIPAHHAHNLSSSAPPSAPPTLSNGCDDDVCTIVRPQPKPRSNSRSRDVDQSPSNRDDTGQLPSKRGETEQLPSNIDDPDSLPTTTDQLPSNRDTTDQLPSDRESPLPPVPKKRTGSLCSDPLPSPSPSSPLPSPSSSPLPSHHHKFSPPPSPRSPRSLRPRPPSPLVSTRRASGASDISSHSSTSSNPGNDGFLATVQRQRTTSLKEKV